MKNAAAFKKANKPYTYVRCWQIAKGEGKGNNERGSQGGREREKKKESK